MSQCRGLESQARAFERPRGFVLSPIDSRFLFLIRELHGGMDNFWNEADSH